MDCVAQNKSNLRFCRRILEWLLTENIPKIIELKERNFICSSKNELSTKLLSYWKSRIILFCIVKFLYSELLSYISKLRILSSLLHEIL